MLRRQLSRAFTLLEILIAIVILVVGITGIVALFPAAIKSGNQTVVDSYASLITQSVVDAINVGVRETRYRYAATPTADAWEYFIFDHDGVNDDIHAAGAQDPSIYTQVADQDFCILLPRGTPGNVQSRDEMVLHFPCPQDKISNRRNPVISNPDLNDERITPDDRRRTVDDPNGSGIFQVKRVYQLGRERGRPNVLRDEFLGEAVGGGASTTIERKRIDPYPQYSFSFSLQRARVDLTAPRGRLDPTDPFSDNLFEVKIKIFRNFNQDLIARNNSDLIQRNNIWIHEFVTLISK